MCDDSDITLSPEEHEEAVIEAEQEDAEEGELDAPSGPAPVANARVDCPYCGNRKDANDDICPWCKNTGKVETNVKRQDHETC